MTSRPQNIRSQRAPLELQLVSSRTVPFIDSRSLAPSHAREALFRTNSDLFVLYLADGGPSPAGEERIIYLDFREALIWLNEAPEQSGSFWT